MKQFLIITVLGSGICGLAGAQSVSPLTRDGAYWVRSIQGTFDTSANDRLRVTTTGSVTLQGVDAGQGSYTLSLRIRTGSQRQAEALFDRVSVKTSSEGGWTHVRVTPSGAARMALDLTVTASKGLRQVQAQTAGGNIRASDWDGDLEARTAGGQIALDRMRGRSDVQTGGGDIRIGAVSGSLRASSGGGVVRVENAGADVTLETAGGEIFVHQAKGHVQASTGGGNIRIDNAGGAVVARTAGGLIQVQQADGPVTAETSGGAIQVNSANGVRCESAGGAIRLRDVAGALRAFASSGSILAELVGGRSLANSILSTNAGDITVVIPSNLALTVQAMNESGGSGRIHSDFSEIRTRSAGYPGVGTVMAEGALNGGGPLLRVNVTGGTIYLRRAK